MFISWEMKKKKKREKLKDHITSNDAVKLIKSRFCGSSFSSSVDSLRQNSLVMQIANDNDGMYSFDEYSIGYSDACI